VIFTKLKQGQLDDSGLTLEDLRTLSTKISDTLVSVYHNRIRYPWQDEEREKAQKAAANNGQDDVDVDVDDESNEHPIDEHH